MSAGCSIVATTVACRLQLRHRSPCHDFNFALLFSVFSAHKLCSTRGTGMIGITKLFELVFLAKPSLQKQCMGGNISSTRGCPKHLRNQTAATKAMPNFQSFMVPQTARAMPWQNHFCSLQVQITTYVLAVLQTTPPEILLGPPTRSIWRTPGPYSLGKSEAVWMHTLSLNRLTYSRQSLHTLYPCQGRL